MLGTCFFGASALLVQCLGSGSTCRGPVKLADMAMGDMFWKVPAQVPLTSSILFSTEILAHSVSAHGERLKSSLPSSYSFVTLQPFPLCPAFPESSKITIKMIPRALCTALAVCALAFNVVATSKRSPLESSMKRGQKRARDATWEATRQKSSPHLSPRGANSTSRFLNNATQSQPSPPRPQRAS